MSTENVVSADNAKAQILENIQSHQDLIEIIKQDKFKDIEGIQKFERKVLSDLRSFENMLKKPHVKMAQLAPSNLAHFSGIIKQMESMESVSAVFKVFKYELDDMEYTHTTDIVGNDNQVWIKLICRSPRGLLNDFINDGAEKALFAKSREYLIAASQNTHHYRCPQVKFVFPNGVVRIIADILESKNIVCVGERVEHTVFVKSLSDEVLEEINDESLWTDAENFTMQRGAGNLYVPPINLDVTAVFVLISNLTHEGGLDWRFTSPLQSVQKEKERKSPSRLKLLEKIEGKEWIICQTAVDSVERILTTVAGPMERERWVELKQKVRIVEDAPIEEDEELTRTEIIFRTGQANKAITATSGDSFVRSSESMGIRYEVLLVEARSLSEQKQLPLV